MLKMMIDPNVFAALLRTCPHSELKEAVVLTFKEALVADELAALKRKRETLQFETRDAVQRAHMSHDLAVGHFNCYETGETPLEKAVKAPVDPMVPPPLTLRLLKEEK